MQLALICVEPRLLLPIDLPHRRMVEIFILGARQWFEKSRRHVRERMNSHTMTFEHDTKFSSGRPLQSANVLHGNVHASK